MPYANTNGVKLYFEVYGEGKPLVFIHGIGISSKVWSFQREILSKDFRMIVYDLRGSGKSEKTPQEIHTADMMSEDLKGLVDFLRLDRISLVAISLGAAVAMKFAIKYPEKVDCLILTGAFADLKGILYASSRYFSWIIGKLLMFKFFGELATKFMLPSAPRRELLYYHKNFISIDRDEVTK